MSEGLAKLVYMANQIARNLAHEADPVAATADHLARFWDPRMKTAIAAHLAAGGADLSPVAQAAVRHLQDRGPPPPQTRATTSGGSDAG